MEKTDAIDVTKPLYDSDGYEHSFVVKSALEIVTRYNGVFCIWDARTGCCLRSGVEECRLTNTPLSKKELAQRKADGLRMLIELQDQALDVTQDNPKIASRHEISANSFRIPDIDQLSSLIKDTSFPSDEPQIDLVIFPSRPYCAWSRDITEHSEYSRVYGIDAGNAMLVNFYTGCVDFSNRHGSEQVLLVRDGVELDPAWPELDTQGRWLDCGEGLAYDRTTGLQWQRFMVGQSWKDGQPTGEAEELTHIEALKRYGDMSVVNDEESNPDPHCKPTPKTKEKSLRAQAPIGGVSQSTSSSSMNATYVEATLYYTFAEYGSVGFPVEVDSATGEFDEAQALADLVRMDDDPTAPDGQYVQIATHELAVERIGDCGSRWRVTDLDELREAISEGVVLEQVMRDAALRGSRPSDDEVAQRMAEAGVKPHNASRIILAVMDYQIANATQKDEQKSKRASPGM